MRAAGSRIVAILVPVGLAALTGDCGRGATTAAGPDSGTTEQPEGWDRELGIAPPTDLNPDPHILEVNIEAAVTMREIVAGTTTAVWTYNGQIPGPTLRAAVGDRVIVHFTNHLPESTTVHWHGIRLAAAMDGTPLERRDLRREVRRPSRHLDVPLSHPRPRRDRDDGNAGGRALTRVEG